MSEAVKKERREQGNVYVERCVMWSPACSTPWGFASPGTIKSLNYIAAISSNLNSKSLVSKSVERIRTGR